MSTVSISNEPYSPSGWERASTIPSLATDVRGDLGQPGDPLKAALEQLQIVRPLDLIPHEQADPNRVRSYARQIEEDGYLRHPPLVVRIRNGCLVILDGHNRVAACLRLRLPHLPVQVLELVQVGLTSWVHRVKGVPELDVIKAFSDVGFQPSSDQPSPYRVTIVGSGGNRTVLRPATDDVGELIARIRQAVSRYTETASVLRVDVGRAGLHGTEVEFPRFTIRDFISTVAGSIKWPAGLSRFSPTVPRLLQLEIPLALLRADGLLEAKELLLRQQLASAGVRETSVIEHYHGPNLVPCKPLFPKVVR